MKIRNSHDLLQLGREALAYCQCASALISGNKALFVSVDLIGEKNQVILEFIINPISRILSSNLRSGNSLLSKTIKPVLYLDKGLTLTFDTCHFRRFRNTKTMGMTPKYRIYVECFKSNLTKIQTIFLSLRWKVFQRSISERFRKQSGLT